MTHEPCAARARELRTAHLGICLAAMVATLWGPAASAQDHAASAPRAADDLADIDELDPSLANLKGRTSEPRTEIKVDSNRAGRLLGSPNLREAAHEVDVEAFGSAAVVRYTIVLHNRAESDQTLRYVLPVDEQLQFQAARICSGQTCTRAWRADDGHIATTAQKANALSDETSALWLHATPLSSRDAALNDDPRFRLNADSTSITGINATASAALQIDAGPVRPSEALRIELEAVASPNLHEGQFTLHIPRRATLEKRPSNELATTVVRVRGSQLASVRVGNTRIDDASAVRSLRYSALQPIAITARIARSGARQVSALQSDANPQLTATLWTFACGQERCGTFELVNTEPLQGSVQDFFILVDVSPSMSDAERTQAAGTIQAIADALPGNARVQLFALGGRAENVTDTWVSPKQLSPALIVSTPFRDLGPLARFDAAWEQIRPQLSERTGIIYVGDGDLTDSVASRRALQGVAEQKSPLAVVHIGSDTLTSALRDAAQASGGFVVPVAGTPGADVGALEQARMTDALRALSAGRAARRVMISEANAAREIGAIGPGGKLAWSQRLSAAAPELYVGGEKVPYAITSSPRGIHARLYRTEAIGVRTPAAIAANSTRPIKLTGQAGPANRNAQSELREVLKPLAERCAELRTASSAPGNQSVTPELFVRIQNGDIREIRTAGTLPKDIATCIEQRLSALRIDDENLSASASIPLVEGGQSTTRAAQLDGDVANLVDSLTREAAPPASTSDTKGANPSP